MATVLIYSNLKHFEVKKISTYVSMSYHTMPVPWYQCIMVMYESSHPHKLPSWHLYLWCTVTNRIQKLGLRCRKGACFDVYLNFTTMMLVYGTLHCISNIKFHHCSWNFVIYRVWQNLCNGKENGKDFHIRKSY